tara:strand:- start:1061 stop:3916 length:2856 start_codon:yes stop_codon:yes gene_type:complete
MAWNYTLDNIRQTQAYLLSETNRSTAIFRSNASDGNVHNDVIAPVIVASTNSPSISTKIKSQYGDFIDLPDEFTNSLTPEIKVYKTFIDEIGNEYNYLLPMGSYLGRTEQGKQVVQGVVVKSAEFTRLGGNPAEINTNIKFNLKLFAKDVSSFFTKNSLPPIEGYTGIRDEADAVVITEQMQENIERVVALRTKQWNGTLTAEEELFLRVQSRSNVSPLDITARAEEFRARLDELALSMSHVGPNGERNVAWIDLIKINPGQPLNADIDAALSVVEDGVRIRVEIGYAEITEVPTNFNGTEDEWRHWKRIIENQRETFYLSLFKHQFTFNGYDGVDLSIDFIATGNAKQLTPEADLFHDANAEEAILRLEFDIELKEQEIESVNEDESLDESIRSACIDRITEEIDSMKNSIQEYRVKNKLRLLNQLYLDKANTPATSGRERYSRVFERTFTRPVEEDEEARESQSFKRQIDAEYRYINNLTVASTNELEGATEYDFRSIEGIDLSASEEEGEIGITRTRRSDGTAADLFIFLGDIIESALEILVPGENELQTETVGSERLSYGDNFLTRQFAWTTSASLYLKNLVHGGTSSSSSIHVFRPPFCWNTGDAAGIEVQRQRLNAALSQFGGILTGTVSYTDPNRVNSGIIKTVKIRDIPIALDIFRSWWINTYVKSGKKSLHFRDFVVALMRFVEKEVFKETPLNFGRQEERIDDPRFIVNNVSFGDATFGIIYASMGNTFRNVREASIFPPWHDERGKHFTTIEAVDSNPVKTSEVPNIIFGETSKGILKKVNFQREDIPGHAEARLFSDRESTASNLALREKYNTSLEMVGNVSFLPGSLFYLDPLPLDIGYVEERESLARSLGLGGMYRVVNLTSVLSFDAAGNSWNTKVNTKWESFGDGDTGATAVTNPTPALLGVCQEELDAVTRQEEIDAAAAEQARGMVGNAGRKI